MEYVIHGRKPESVFRYFEEISAIPRSSYHEEGIADYLVSFAKQRGLEFHRDEYHNVLIKAPATPGMEAKAPILFQGHTDMVCEKNGDVAHDFMRDPLVLRVDGNLLRATGTTLGGDDGIAVAMMLALLDGEIPNHPAYECLFTTAEEVGLNGALGFDYRLLKARRMINLDSEDLGVITSGCAGGLRSDLSLPFSAVPFSGTALCISVKGLAGGHSGQDINSGRANANKVMGRLLASLAAEQEFSLLRINGGSKDNAIPRECEAVVAVADIERAVNRLTDTAAAIAAELVVEDRGFTCNLEEIEQETEMLSGEDTRRVLGVLCCSANGVFEMDHHVRGLVETSRNLGVIRTEEGCLTFVFSSRSSRESRLDASIDELDALARICGCKTRHYSRYPGWEYAPHSSVRDGYIAAYRDVTGKEPTVNVIHAGLECGIIYSHVPDMDMISIGPDLRDIHSPNETMDLDSVEVFWKTIARWIETL